MMNTQFDYRGRISRASAFVRGLASRFGDAVSTEAHVGPPLAERRLSGLERKLGMKLPLAVSRFMTEGSSDCQLEYRLTLTEAQQEQLDSNLSGQETVWGGPALCRAWQLAKDLKDCREWAEETWVAEEPEQLAIWRSALPVMAIPNGDYLAVDISKSHPDPPVIYLCHDEASTVIAPAFTVFLAQWEQLCYLGPELCLLEEFTDNATGHLQAASEAASRLRALLGMK